MLKLSAVIVRLLSPMVHAVLTLLSACPSFIEAELIALASWVSESDSLKTVEFEGMFYHIFFKLYVIMLYNAKLCCRRCLPKCS